MIYSRWKNLNLRGNNIAYKKFSSPARKKLARDTHKKCKEVPEIAPGKDENLKLSAPPIRPRTPSPGSRGL